MRPRPILLTVLIAIAAGTLSAKAQDIGTLSPQPLPPLANPNDPKIGAKQLFARKVLPSAQPTRSIGSYTKGCIAGAVQMPLDGATWQVMRLSRNRYWGHPETIALHGGSFEAAVALPGERRGWRIRLPAPSAAEVQV